MLRFLSAGESHGPQLTVILDGLPAGLAIDEAKLNRQLALRQHGYGRGNRQKIETDRVNFVGGVRHGFTTGAPVAMEIVNKDFENWQNVMASSPVDMNDLTVQEDMDKKKIKTFRPGHADFAGTVKFKHSDIRNVLERASARETASRVAVGALCLQLLEQLGIDMVSHVIQVGNISGANGQHSNLSTLQESILKSELFCADSQAEEKMLELIKEKWQEGDTLGGVIEVLADGLPIGLGSYTQWDGRLDGKLAQAVMSVQAMKAVEIGDGFIGASSPGSMVHDPLRASNGNTTDDKSLGDDYAAISHKNELPIYRLTNHAGGVEGGMTNGERLCLRAYMKPIPTMRKGLPSVSYPGFENDTAHFERSDVCAIAAASVVVKAMVAFVLVGEILGKFGKDNFADIKTALNSYRNYCKEL